MATGIRNYDSVANNNTDLAGVDVDEGMAMNLLNNAFRALMAELKKWNDDISGKLVSGGSANAQTLTTNSALTAYADGQGFWFIAGFTVTGAATMNINAVGAKAIRKKGDVALENNDMLAGGLYFIAYDASANGAAGAWMLANPNNTFTATDYIAQAPITETSVISPAALATDQADWAPTGGSTAGLIRVDASANVSITGLSLGQVDGRRVTIHNISSTVARLVTLEAEDAASSAANRIAGRADVQLWAGESAVLRYDATSSRWRVMAIYQNATGQQSVFVPAGAMIPRTTSGAAAVATEESTTNKEMTGYLAFDPTSIEYAGFYFQMPKSANINSSAALVAQFIWKHPATTTNFGVRWGIRAVGVTDNEAIDSAYGTAAEVTDTGGTTARCYVSPETAGFAVGNSPSQEDMVWLEIYRDPTNGADTMAVDAHLIGVRFHYTTRNPTDD